VVRAGRHVGHFYNQFGIAGDLGAELTAVDALCQLGLGGDERPRWGWVVAGQDARVAPETKAQTSANRTYSGWVFATPEWFLRCASAWVARSVKPTQNVADAISLLISLPRKAIRPLELHS
jgi:hypothetical protein